MITLLWGLAVNWLIIGSFFLIAASWKAVEILHRNICLAETKDGRLGKSKRLEKDVALPHQQRYSHQFVWTDKWLNLSLTNIVSLFSLLHYV